ncbi:MAG: hypothetical protein Q7V10_02115 [Methanobacteriaceae archaeon]|nr:hypothetical protein [Methanobacteriaceae archaeon]MDO9626003.1 hypothetical protein [Methanobacteriaceae archaeon]
MRIKDIKSYLKIKDSIPEDQELLENWFKMEDVLNFLLNSDDGMVPIYIQDKQNGGLFLYSLLVSEEKLKGNFVEDLLNWSFMISSGYGYGYSYSNQEKTPFLCEPMDSADPELLDGSTPIFFLRECFNHTSEKLEINQKISHILEICWNEKRKAFCKFNDVGDFIDIATMEDKDNLTLCTLRKEELYFYMYLSKSVLIRFIDIMRYSKNFKKAQHDKRQELILKDPENEIYGSLRIEILDDDEINFSWMRAFQIIRNKVSDEKMMKQLMGKEDREYESFIINDFKNDRIVEWSSNPEKLANYFIESDNPYETSPAFFKPEVLSKYKQDPEKYTVHSQSIECRGSWSLDYIDINEEGQVFAFMYQISRLPYSEQKYWKSFNEKPKAGISKRAYDHYFLGKWDSEYDPLISLKNILDTFPQAKFGDEIHSLWKMPKMPPTKDIKFLNYVVTDSTKEWEDQISVLNQILIEGLRSKTIKKIAKYLKCDEKNVGSVYQLKKCLKSLNVDETDIGVIVNPLFELLRLRKIVVHTIDEPYPDEDFKLHYRNLLTNCDKSMHKLADFIEEGLFNILEEK